MSPTRVLTWQIATRSRSGTGQYRLTQDCFKPSRAACPKDREAPCRSSEAQKRPRRGCLPEQQRPQQGSALPRDQEAPSQMVLASTAATSYGSALAFGRRSSMYPLPSLFTCHGMRTDAPLSETP